ncbi:MAG: HAMP domain-containing sensor histidine kinase, partial [Verrucomicrobiota bacterium]
QAEAVYGQWNRGEIQTGWIPWYSENKLYMIGWVRNIHGMIYGVELEMVTILSRLVNFIPASSDKGEEFALIDGSGKIFHQSGPACDDAEPMLKMALGALLPHWQLAVYSDGSTAYHSADLISLLYTLLVSIFVFAIAVGGFLLLWQSHRNLRDAHQKTSFVSNVSHELKTPLTTIRMYAELIGEGRVKDEKKRRNYMKTIIDESQRLTRLVNNVLDFGRLEENKKKYHMEDLNLSNLVDDVVETQRMRTEEAGMAIDTVHTDQPLHVHIDRDAVEQTLLNLIDNSIKYAKDGKQITVELSKNTTVCFIRVRDQGPGIPESQREKIFEKFHRVDDSLTSGTQGSGLGLSIARRLIRGMGGDLNVNGKGKDGAEFVMTLPMQQEFDNEVTS